jgi:hypothetical protein
MAISKIKGTIEEKTFGDHAIIRVWAFKEGNTYFSEEVDILEEFNDDYFIFSPKFFVRHSNFKIGDLVEIFVSNNGIDYKDNTSSYPSVKDTNCVSTGFRLIELPLNAFIAENSLNLDALSFDINTLSDIYFHSEDFLFGPFKKENQGIKPKVGKEVGRFQYTDGIIIPSEDKLYILNAPTQNTKICDVDCMINDQIVDFLRTKLANISSIDFNSLRRQFSSIQLNGLEQERLTKAQKYLSELELNYTIIKNLIEKNIDFKQIFEKAIENNKEEIKAEYKAKTIQPLQKQKEQIEKEINEKRQEKEKADNQLNKSKKELKPLQEQFEFLEKEKERLIQDIKVHALIQQTPSVQVVENEKFYSYDIQDFSKEVTLFKELNDFRRDIRGIVEDNLAVRCFDLLKEYKCLLANDIALILAIAKATNNCKVLIQQVEPDWLKFEQFYENGLKQIWQSAHQEPDKIHFLLLQDLNMASIECYGRPVLDLLTGVRVYLPIGNTPFPKNLWIFGFPIIADEDDNFGLPLIKKTFKHWGGLPKTNDERVINDIQSENKLTVAQISEYDNISSGYLNDYFE